MKEKRAFVSSEMKMALERILPYYQANPKIVQEGIGLEAFIEDLHKACLKFAEYFHELD